MGGGSPVRPLPVGAMPRKRKRLNGFVADCGRFAIKLTAVAADGVPVPGVKGATGGVGMLLDKLEARGSNLDDEKQARARVQILYEQLSLLENGQLAPDEIEPYQKKIHEILSQMPNLSRKSKLKQLVRADKYARDIVDCNTALDRLHRDIELQLGRKSLAISHALQGAQQRQEDTLQGVVHSVAKLDQRVLEMQGSLVIALRRLPERSGEPLSEGVKQDPSFPKVSSLSPFVLFSTQGSQVPGWN